MKDNTLEQYLEHIWQHGEFTEPPSLAIKQQAMHKAHLERALILRQFLKSLKRIFRTNSQAKSKNFATSCKPIVSSAECTCN